MMTPFHHLSINHSSVFFVSVFLSIITSAFCQNDIDFLCSSPNFVASDGAGEGHGQNTGNGGQTSIYKDLKQKWKKVKIFEVAKNGTVNLCHNVNVRKVIRDYTRKQSTQLMSVFHFNVSVQLSFQPNADGQGLGVGFSDRLKKVELLGEADLPMRINYTRILTTEVVVHDFWDGQRHFDGQCVKIFPYEIPSNSAGLVINVVSLLNGTILSPNNCPNHELQVQLRVSSLTSEMLGTFTMKTSIRVWKSGDWIYQIARVKPKQIGSTSWELKKDHAWRKISMIDPDESREYPVKEIDTETTSTIIAVVVVNIIIVIIFFIFVFKKCQSKLVEDDTSDKTVAEVNKAGLPIQTLYPPLPLPSSHPSTIDDDNILYSLPTPQMPRKKSRLFVRRNKHNAEKNNYYNIKNKIEKSDLIVSFKKKGDSPASTIVRQESLWVHGPPVVEFKSDALETKSVDSSRDSSLSRKWRFDDDDDDDDGYRSRRGAIRKGRDKDSNGCCEGLALFGEVCDSPPFVLFWCGILTANLTALLWALYSLDPTIVI